MILSLGASALLAGDDDFFYRRGVVEYENRMYRFAIEDMERVLAINPGHYRAANVLGDIYRGKKLMKKALDYYRMSIGANPSQPAIHYRIGTLYDFFYDGRASVHHYLKAVELDPSHGRAHLKLVRHYLLEKKDRAAADRHFSESYRLGREKGDAFLALAKKEYDLGREPAALAMYRKAIAKNPADLETYFRVSEIYRRGKDYRKAVRYLEKVKHIRPDSERAHVMLGNLYYTTPLSQNRKFLIGMAITNLDAALSLNPENRDALLLLSEIHRKLGNIDRADTLLKKFEKLEGDDKR
jgi:tetratricopeptide (TPR) repeat protein